MPEISTPDWERDAERTCPDCGHTAAVSVVGYQHQTWWDCPNCGATQTGEE